jgi:hypothetical protein
MSRGLLYPYAEGQLKGHGGRDEYLQGGLGPLSNRGKCALVRIQRQTPGGRECVPWGHLGRTRSKR